MSVRRPARPDAVRALLLALALVLGLGGLSGCSTTLGDVPLPGTGVSGETITVEADFAEALNLATGATVKVNGIDSGKVQDVAARDFTARVEMLVQTSAQLRQGATARLRYTTPLGELFVDVTNPSEGGLLADGATLGLDDTSTAPTVEDTLSQASLLVNGGGLGDLQTVTEELNTALGGREDTARSLLERSRRFLAEANATTADIDRALRSLSSVSVTLREREQVIDRAVREITPAARVLRQNTPGLTRLLRQVELFSASANDTVAQTRRQVHEILDQAAPVLRELSANRERYPLSLERLITLGKVTDNLVPGDYLALSAALHVDGIRTPDLADLLDQLGIPLPDLPGLPGLPGPPQLPLRAGADDPRSLSGLLGRAAPAGADDAAGPSDAAGASGRRTGAGR